MKKISVLFIVIIFLSPISTFGANNDLKEKTFNEIDTLQENVSSSLDNQELFKRFSFLFLGVENFRNEIGNHFEKRIGVLKKIRNKSILEQSFNIVDGQIQLDKPKEKDEFEKNPIGENLKRFFVFVEFLWSLLMYKIFSQVIVFYVVFGLIIFSILRVLCKKIINTYRRQRFKRISSVR